MARRNRVTPLGELVADPARGLVYGNRGCLVGAPGEVVRPFQVRRWIACRLEFQGRRRRPLMAPGRYTELFFADEATALAAGHRACAECRRADYDRLREIWAELYPHDGPVRADRIDDRLHAERWSSTDGGRRFGAGRRLLGEPVRVTSLPDGAMVADADGAPWLVLGRELLRWTVEGYTERIPRPARKRMAPITPPSLIAVLRAGWEPVVPLLHPTARP